jgi:hypothetical protein
MHERLNKQTLAVRTSELEHQIENGIKKPDGTLETDPRILTGILNAYLTSGAELYRTLARANTGVNREENGVKALQFLRAKRGRYHKEKTLFCIDQSNHPRLIAEAFEVQITEEEAGPFVTQSDEIELATQNRTQAANWLRMAAACLEMPGENEQ